MAKLKSSDDPSTKKQAISIDPRFQQILADVRSLETLQLMQVKLLGEVQRRLQEVLSDPQQQ